jgi:hypothetical protein
MKLIMHNFHKRQKQRESDFYYNYGIQKWLFKNGLCLQRLKPAYLCEKSYRMVLTDFFEATSLNKTKVDFKKIEDFAIEHFAHFGDYTTEKYCL